MRARHFRSGLAAGLTLTLLAITTSPGIAPAQANTPIKLAPGIKRLQVQWLMEGAREHRERQERLTELLRKRAAELRTKLGGKQAGSLAARHSGQRRRPAADLNEAGGAQGARLAASAKVTPTGVSAVNGPPTNHIMNNRAGDGAIAGQAEVCIAALGNNMVAAWNDGQGFYTPPHTQGWGYSTDGGNSWTDGGAPPVPAAFPTLAWTSDPVVMVNERTGDFYYTALCDPATGINGAAVIKGNFSGSSFTWGTPQVVRTVPNSLIMDKEWMAVDSTKNNKNIYISYSLFTATDDSIEFQRSTDNNVTWGGVQKLSSLTGAGRVQGSRPCVGPSGEVYVVWYEIGTAEADHFRIRKSVNGGVSFGAEQTVVDFYPNPGNGAPGFNRERGIQFPSIAIDRSLGPHRGRVYVAWNEAVDAFDDPIGYLTTQAEVENDGFYARAVPFTIGQVLEGALSTSGNDLDYWSFVATQGTTYIFYCDSLGASINYTMRIFCGADTIATTRLAFSGDPGPGSSGGTGLIIWTAPSSGTYYLRMADVANTGGYHILTGVDSPTAGERARDGRDVFVNYSDDGTTWSTPTMVNDDAPLYDNWLPEVAVSSTGEPYAAWYDWRDAPASTCGGVSHIYLARSDDAGASWVSLGATTDAQTAWTSVGSNIAPNQGDYMSLFANNNGVYPAWSDGRNGDPDVFMANWPLALTPVELSLVSAEADPGRVRLAWYAADAPGLIATVYRSQDGVSWSALGMVSPNGTGQVLYEDDAVVAGQRYGYRLGVMSGGGRESFFGEAWVVVPAAFGLAIQNVRPNPTDRAMWVSLTLPSAAPAWLALVDIAGRQLRSRELEARAGAQLVNLGEGGPLAPGIYLIRLSQAGRSVVTRATVMR